MKKHSSWQRILPVLFVALLSGIIPSLLLQPLYAQSSSTSLNDSYSSGIYNYQMWGTSTVTVTGAGQLSETFNMYGTRTFTERDYVLLKGSTTIASSSWPDDETYSSSPGFQQTVNHTGLATGTYTVKLHVQLRHSGQTWWFSYKTHDITLYGPPVTVTPTITDRTTTSLTISSTVTNAGHGISSGRIKIGSTWYPATVTGSTLSYTKTGLTSGTAYTVIAEATTIEGTAQSSSASLSTLTAVLPSVSTQAMSAIVSAAATGNGNITNLGVPNPTAYGHCWAITSSPTTANSFNDNGAASATGAYTSSLTGLSGNTLYYVKAYATNEAGTSYGGQVNFTTPPAAIGARTATNITSTGFTGNWTAPAGATGYYLDVSTTGFTTYVPGYQARDVGNVTSYAVTGLSSYTSYSYRIRAYSANGTASNGGSASVRTAPAAPTATAATTITSTGFSANWGTVTGANSYRFDLSTSSSFTTFVAGYSNLDVGAYIYKNVTGLSNGTTYYYRVRAYNSSYTSTSDNSNTITTITIPPAPTASAASSILTDGFSANWSATTGAANYLLDVSTVADFASYVYSNANVGLVTTWSVSGLTANTTYYYRVKAVNTGGTSSNSNVITTATYLLPTVTTQAISSIANTTATGNGNVTALGVPNPTEHGHCWDTASSPTTSDTKTILGAKSATGAFTSSMTGLATGTLYYVRAYATNAAGTVYGSQVSFTTIPAAPTASAATSITVSGFTANWAATTGATKYYFDVSTSSSFASFVAGYNNLDVGNVLLKAVTGLSAGTTYYYRVRAYNASGTSASSNTITVVTYQTPTVTTQAVTSMATTTATGNGNVTALGVPNPTQHGHCWATTSNPTTSNYYTAKGAKSTTGAFTSSMTGMTAGTLYYVKAYATNAAGTVYGGEVSFTTISSAPVATEASSINSTGFSANWNASTGATSYLLYVSSASNFSSHMNGYSGLNVGNVITYSVSGLSAGTTYYYRLRAVNTGGNSAYSNTISTSSYQTPTVTTQAVTSITTTTATGNGNVTALGNPNPTQHGHCWGTVENPTIDDNKTELGTKTTIGTFTSALTGLTAGTEYFVRAYATNNVGTSYGEQVSFVTIPAAPVAKSASGITTGGFTAEWNATTEATGYRIDVSTVIGFGSCLTGYNNQDVGNNLSYPVTGLIAGMTYYYRVRAYNASGTSINSGIITVNTTATYNVTIDRGNITGVHIFTDEMDYGIDPVNPLVFPAGYNGTFHAEKTDYIWSLANGSDSNIITNLTTDQYVNFIGTYTYVDPVNQGFVYTGEPDIPVTATAGTIETLVAPLPALTPVNAVVIVFTGITTSDLTISVPVGTWWVIAYYNDPADGGWNWHHSHPYPATGPLDVVFYNVPFGAKSDIPVIITGEGTTLPVELSAFTALTTADFFIKLDWTAQSETSLAGYYIYRNTELSLSTALRINSIISATNSSQATVYSYTDSEVETGKTYYYWLQVIELDGSISYHGPVSIVLSNPGDDNDPPEIPVTTVLHDAFPNPFNPRTTFSYYLKQPESVNISVFNSKGQRVKQFSRNHNSAGNYSIVWDGRSDRGNLLASGIYCVVMTTENYCSSIKVVMLK